MTKATSTPDTEMQDFLKCAIKKNTQEMQELAARAQTTSLAIRERLQSLIKALKYENAILMQELTTGKLRKMRKRKSVQISQTNALQSARAAR